MHFGFHIFSNHFPLALYSLLFPERQYAKPEGTVTVYHLAEGGGMEDHMVYRGAEGGSAVSNRV